MEWTMNTPTKIGFYWVLDGDAEEPELVRVHKVCHYTGGLEIVRLGSEVHDSILLGHYAEEEGCSMLWFGPLDLCAPEGWKNRIGALRKAV